MGMAKEERDRERIEAVLQILRKQMSLTVKQEKFCTDACVARFLKSKGENAKKAAKQLKACLSWRETFGIEHLMADEFSEELAEGVAYVAGHDDETRPVMVFRIKQDYAKLRSQRYLRLLVFTLEVATSSMSRFADQFVLLFDASFFRSASAFLNLFAGSLKLISEFYPGRLHKAFVIDSPSLFPYLWRGSRPFVDLWTSTAVVSSLDFDSSLEEHRPLAPPDYRPGTTSLRFHPSSVPSSAAKLAAGSASSRFSFTVSRFDSLKPWYLSRSEPSPSPSPCASISPLNARSFSFAVATPASIPSTPSTAAGAPPPRTPRPSFLLQSPAVKFLRMGIKAESSRDSFLPFLRFYRRPYDELAYRAKMKPPLGGLISIVSPARLARPRRPYTHHLRS